MADDDKVPFLLQSSNLDHKKRAEEIGAGFIHKYSKSLSLELRNYIIQNLAFGPFVFRNPAYARTYRHCYRPSDSSAEDTDSSRQLP